MNRVTYHASPVRVHSVGRFAFMMAVFLCLLVAVGAYALTSPAHGAQILALGVSAGSLLVGLNTVTYEWPVAGVTAPTASQAKKHSTLVATITGDGTATSFVIVHNWALTAAELAAGFPTVSADHLLAAGYTAALLTGARATNQVTFANTAFTGAGLRITLARPFSMVK